MAALGFGVAAGAGLPVWLWAREVGSGSEATQILLSALGALPVHQKPGSGDPSGFVVPLAIFGLLMLVIIVAAAKWHRAPRTPWFWLAGAIPGILFFLPDIPIIVQAATSPESVLDVVLAIAVTGGCVVLLISAAMSFQQARRLARSAVS